MRLHPADGGLPPGLYWRQVSLCQAGGLYFPHACLPAHLGLPDAHRQACQRIPTKISVDFHPLCRNGDGLCSGFQPVARTPGAGGTEPACRGRSAFRLARGALLVPAHADALRPALLRRLPPGAGADHYPLHPPRTLLLRAGTPAICWPSRTPPTSWADAYWHRAAYC